MTNREIAQKFKFLADLIDVHGKDKYRGKTYNNVYVQLRKQTTPLETLDAEQLEEIRGVGKSSVSKILEIVETGSMKKLDEYLAITPPGIQDLISIKGLGPKKIAQLWKELEIESVGELLYACNENRLIALSGFGDKTQADIQAKLLYFLQSQDKFHYATFEQEALALIDTIKKTTNSDQVSLTSDMRRNTTIVKQIELLAEQSLASQITPLITVSEHTDNKISGKTNNEIPVTIHLCTTAEFGSKLFRTTGPRHFLEAFVEAATAKDFTGLATEQAVFEKAGIHYIEPALRDDDAWIAKAKQQALPQLIMDSDIKGILHNHSTYSDGLHTLREMAEYTRDSGYEYLGITDHSQAAFYAGGLKPDRVIAQMEEIDQLNKELAPFKIFKGIESDILNDGRLDYHEDILERFDFIVASVHTNLKMDEEKATQRLITAIENPFTTILGHPTGRLLLAREGYPIDHKRIIDACAANNVVIELNANPHRLDIDWVWIPYALERGVKIAINPDAHSMDGIHHVHFGVCAARKGGLTAGMCLNAMNLKEFEAFLG